VTFATPETLIFAVPDFLLSDNHGGISVLVAPVQIAGPSAPEPASYVLIAAGIGALGLWRRRR
jgi:hypothetical protein